MHVAVDVLIIAVIGRAVRCIQARAALAMPASKALAPESAAAFVKRTAGIDAQQCPCCDAGRLRVLKTLGAASARRRAAGSNRSCQGIYSAEVCPPASAGAAWLANGAGTSP